MSHRAFSVTYDYRCPFARNVHEHLLDALAAGADWEVDFAPFSLSQIHVEDGQPAVWDDPDRSPDLLAMEAGIAVRDQDPEHFAAVHRSLFAARHDLGLDLRDPDVVRRILGEAGADADSTLAAVADGWPRGVFRKSHQSLVDGHRVFGVPTFIMGERSVFVRITTRPGGDGPGATPTIDHVLALIEDHPELNEFKHTSIAR